jgi:Domain of unknown function (DUF6249)
MIRSTLLRAGALVTSLAAAPLALAQQTLPAPGTAPAPAGMPEHWGFIGVMAGMGLLFTLGIIAIVFFTENRRQRQKLALVERLVTGGQPVPRELMTNEPRMLTLPEQYRHDIRRAIAFMCWGIGFSVVFYMLSAGNPRSAAWGLLLILPGLGNFLKAWLVAREIARGSADGTR